MTPRYIIRPSNILSTPRRIAQVLGAQRTVSPAVSQIRIPDWNRDFFLYYPHIWSRFGPEEYQICETFQGMNKSLQRGYIRSQFVKTPEDYPAHEERYVHRPLRHHSGQGWDVSLSSTPRPGWYCSPLFPKRHEYRVLYTKGKRIATLKKRVPDDGIPLDQPWNHANGSSFVTVENEGNDRLRHTTVYDDLARLPIINRAHLTGVDVLYAKLNGVPCYAVLEVNLCPSMSITANLEKLREYVSSSNW
jgi:hypothetical protein